MCLYINLSTHELRRAVDQKWQWCTWWVFATNQKQMRDMKVMANTDSCMVALYTTCDLNITRLPTPHVSKQHSPPHHSWNSHILQSGHSPHQSALYWMLAKQVSDHPARSGDNYSGRWWGMQWWQVLQNITRRRNTTSIHLHALPAGTLVQLLQKLPWDNPLLDITNVKKELQKVLA